LSELILRSSEKRTIGIRNSQSPCGNFYIPILLSTSARDKLIWMLSMICFYSHRTLSEQKTSEKGVKISCYTLIRMDKMQGIDKPNAELDKEQC
jgi:hypothetical protein